MVVVLPFIRTVASTITSVVVSIIRLGTPSLYCAANANAIAPLSPGKEEYYLMIVSVCILMIVWYTVTTKLFSANIFVKI